MDFRQLEMFHAVAKNSSFTQAGKQLFVAQSAISRKIGLLEQELGEKLFKRLNKRIFLTPAGEVMLRYTRHIFQDLRNAALEVSDIAQLNRGVLRIGSGMTACMYLLPPVIEAFQARYPKVEIRVVTGTSEALLSQLRNSELDLGVLTLPVKCPDLEMIPFTTEELVVVVSPKHRVLATRRTVKAEDLKSYPMILFNHGTSTRWLIDEHFKRLGFQPHAVMESESVATIKPLVRINLGISLLPLRAVAAEVKRGELHYLRIRAGKLTREIALVVQKSDYKPKALVELMALFRSRG
ncbi:MAG TPA: LysR family transcriptional regulator [Bryobacteraceae bacterium]|jgi:DNA-binding transcriptional LysR family regulator|nr:LysR family transcriptional regulator [Bryobacteraceae bacterium]